MRTTWEHGWWDIETAAPHPSIAPQVVGDYVGWTEHTANPVRRIEAAGTIIPLILNFGAPYRLLSGADGGQRSLARGSFMAGLYDTWAAVDGAHESCALQVNFTPLAAFQLLRTPLHLLHNGSEEFAALLGRDGSTLIEQLGNAADWSARFDILDAFLRRRLTDAPAVSGAMQWCWQQIASTEGRVTVRELMAQTGWSPRRLISEFRTHCGVPPRTVLGVRRFEHALALLGHRARQTPSMAGRWSSLALDCGYADQSHLVRDFTRFAGCSPTAYLRGQLQTGGGVVDLSAPSDR